LYHIELRQFPHNFSRFNLTDGDLAELLEPWLAGRPVELGERKWSPHQARLTILEGPEIPLDELSLGRGWRTAQRRSEDVTDRLLTGAMPTQRAAAAPPSPPPPGAAAPLSDPLAVGVQIAALLGPDAARLLEAWRAAASRAPDLSPSETLMLAERSLGGDRPGP
jgi:hypothetical protein